MISVVCDGAKIAGWDSVEAEYIDLLQDDSKQDIFELHVEATKLDNQIRITQMCIDALLIQYNEIPVLVLKQMGYRVNIDQKEPGKGLQIIITQAKSIAMRRDEIITEIQTRQPKGESKITRADFDNNLVHLSKFQGYRVSKDVFLSEYVAIKNAYAQYIKSLENGSRSN